VQLKNIRSFKIIGLVLLALLLAVGCAKDGEKPQANLPPDTHISSYQISYYPATGYNYTTNIYWSGMDNDSYIRGYHWRIIGDEGDSVFDGTTNLSTWQETENQDITLHLDFPNIDKAYTFEIAAYDDKGDADITPVTAIIAKERVAGNNYPPNTEIANGPADGGVTASGVHFVVQGFDVDGIMDTLEYKLDTAATWSKYPADLSSGIATLDIVDLPLGVNTLLFRAHDNSGAVDPTPAAVSFIVSDTLKPYLIVNSGALPGAFYFLPQGGSTTDLATTWYGDATFYFSTTLYRYAVDDTAEYTDWGTATGATLEALTSGTHTFYLQAKDLGGNIAEMETEVGIGPLIGDRGILLVNGIDWVQYAPEMQPMYEAHAAWGTRPVEDFWDLFAGQRANYPPVLHDTLTRKGVGAISGDTLGHYGTMVILLNNYNGDLATWTGMLPLIVTYLKAGGNIVMGARWASVFIESGSDLGDYTHIEFNQIGVNPAGLVAAAAGLVNQPRIAGQSLTDLITTPTDPNTTVLFTVAAYPGSVGGVIYEPESGGKFALICGRPYRYDFEAEAANYDYILQHYMGE